MSLIMSIGLLLEFIAFQENSLTHRKNRVTNSNNKTPTESLPVFSADYSALRKASIRNEESGNPEQGKHQSETRKASIR